MNEDSSVFDLPGYIQSRLKTNIEVVMPPWKIQEEILRMKCPGVDQEILHDVFTLLKTRAKLIGDSVRDTLSLAQYAQKLKSLGFDDAIKKAAEQILVKPELNAADEVN